jgi:hypothetical protein
LFDDLEEPNVAPAVIGGHNDTDPFGSDDGGTDGVEEPNATPGVIGEGHEADPFGSDDGGTDGVGEGNDTDPLAEGEQIARPLLPDEDTRSFTPEDYIERWEEVHGRPLTPQEREVLSKGCIGVTTLNLQAYPRPPLNLCFSTFERAREVADALDTLARSLRPGDDLAELISRNPALANLRDVWIPPDFHPDTHQAAIFSKRFFSNQNQHEGWPDDPSAFRPDPETGQVNMYGYHDQARPRDRYNGYTNFDYGWFDEQTNSWWHANHMEPGMQVYQSTLEHYSRPLLDFNRQVFSVAFARKP